MHNNSIYKQLNINSNKFIYFRCQSFAYSSVLQQEEWCNALTAAGNYFYSDVSESAAKSKQQLQQ